MERCFLLIAGGLEDRHIELARKANARSIRTTAHERGVAGVEFIGGWMLADPNSVVTLLGLRKGDGVYTEGLLPEVTAAVIIEATKVGATLLATERAATG